MISLSNTQLEHFICVAKESSLTKAAEKLHISQQALSKNMRAMEKHLGIKLFVRSEKGMELTKTGEQILPVAESLLSKIKAHEAIIEGIIERNKITLSLLFEHASMAFVIQTDILRKIGDFRIISQTAGSYSRCERDILSGKHDLALVNKPEILPQELEYIPLIKGNPVILMNKNHKLASKEQISIPDLRDVPQILPEAGSQAMKQYIEICIEHGFYPNVVMSSGNLELILRSISENVGVCVSTAYGIRDGYKDDIVSRPLIHQGYFHQVGFLTRRNWQNDPLLLSFINTIEDHYSIK